MNDTKLNLARKWRPKKIDEIVGQELAVRLVKNSVYRGLFFPVYLLSGAKGCGKTTMGRLFAAILNCQELAAFQQNPQKTVLPCSACVSCQAMLSHRHPDFIEIDAASHTGVDNIRQLIDTASFMPVLGSKKVYLIDEAHMLSKAAFNALLKILEEPPLSVVFMLATTDIHKILETIRSRCFQLFFSPVALTQLVEHLATICTHEQISFQRAGLHLIAQESEGSVRDALNLVERVRLACNTITKESVSQTLGFCNEQLMAQLFQAVVTSNIQELLPLTTQIEAAHSDPRVIWKKLVDLIRTALLSKHAIAPVSALPVDLAPCIRACSVEQLVTMLDICYRHEMLFAKTSVPYGVLEIMLVNLAQKKNSISVSKVVSKQSQSAPITASETESLHPKNNQPPHHERAQSMPKCESNDGQVNTNSRVEKQEKQISPMVPEWDRFLRDLETLKDPLILSIFKQARFVAFDAALKQVSLSFSAELTFFKEWLDNTRSLWQVLLEQIFGAQAQCITSFNDMQTPVIIPSVVKTQTAATAPTPSKQPVKFVKDREKPFSITDTQAWQKAHKIMTIFPGTIYAIERTKE